MPGITSQRLARVRAGRVSVVLPALVFLGTGLPVYLSGVKAHRPSPPQADCSATVRLPRHLADPKAAETEILASTNVSQAAGTAGTATSPERIALLKESLRVTVKPGDQPERAEVVIAWTGRQSGEARGLVNSLAEQYARSRGSDLADTAAEAHRNARQAADQAEKDSIEARVRFESFVEQHFRQPPAEQTPPIGDRGSSAEARRPAIAAAPQTPAPPPAPSHAEPSGAGIQPGNEPEWTRLQRQLAALRQHREQLLVNRTPLHPRVRDAEIEIAELERRLAEIPHEMVPSPSGLAETLESATGVPPAPADPIVETPRPSGDEGRAARPSDRPDQDLATPDRAGLVTELAVRREAMDQAQRRWQNLAEAERRAFEAQFTLPAIEVRRAEPPAVRATPPPTGRLLVAAMAVGLTGAVGMAMFSSGAAGEATFASAAEVGGALGVPVLGTVPRGEPRSTHRRHRRTANAWALALSGLALLALCLGVTLSLI